MKKVNFCNLFRTKKFVPENYEADKQLIIDKYNELGYRDAMIVKDSIAQYDEKTVRRLSGYRRRSEILPP